MPISFDAVNFLYQLRNLLKFIGKKNKKQYVRD
jgi:hypothetical protein